MNDADIEQTNLEHQATREERLAKRGICTHGHYQRAVPGNDLPAGSAKCLMCGQWFATLDALLAERAQYV